MFKDKTVILATMHRKEEAIAPVIESSLGCKVIVPSNYNTDQFGTFCGETSRSMSASEMVRHKARKALEQYQFSFGIASEGSFGPHPLIPFSPLDEEYLAWIDLEQGLEIVVKTHTQKTNYGSIEVSKEDDWDEFLLSSLFPSHAMMVRELASNQIVAKGIQSHSELEPIIERAFALSDRIRLETDMRALYNPTRMQVINELSYKLVNRIQSICPECKTYGFGESSVSGSLPCMLCKGEQTTLYKHIVEKCIQCDYQIIKPRMDSLVHADPTYCYYCNP